MTPWAEPACEPQAKEPLAPKGLIRVGGISLVPDVSGAAFMPASATLLVADLHFGKAKALAARGLYWPPYDSADTLARLTDVVLRLQPRRIICLGDSFHRPGQELELEAPSRAALIALGEGRDWIWVKGNHDPSSGEGLFGRSAPEVSEDGVTLRHEPQFRAGEPEIAGHLHPCARIVQRGRSLRRRCFLESRGHLVLPAFGALTGSLNVRDAAFRGAAMAEGARAHLIGRDAVHAVAAARLLDD
jgi:DNA ligase-associated metallophosphoesterase